VSLDAAVSYKGVRPWIVIPWVSEANKAVEGVKKNVWRSEYRFVLAEK
jgi:hypothetical protein